MPTQRKKSAKKAVRMPAPKPMRKTPKPAAQAAPAARNTTLRPSGIYSVHPSVAMVTKWVHDLPAKTGKSLAQWTRFIQTKGPKNEPAAREWLKTEHKLGTNTAWWLAAEAFGTGEEDWDPQAYLVTAERYVADAYEGSKAGLKPLYDALLKLGLNVGGGGGVKACPCKTFVPLFREHVIAQIKPSTRARIDLGLALGPDAKAGKKFPPRLIDTGGLAKKDRITHRFEITSLADIDAEVKKWLRRAYDLDS